MKAKLTRIEVSPRKLRLVANMVRNMNATYALEFLQNVDRKGAFYVRKTIKSALSNASNNLNLSVSDLKIAVITVNESLRMKRYRMGSRSHIQPRIKRFSTLSIELK